MLVTSSSVQSVATSKTPASEMRRNTICNPNTGMPMNIPRLSLEFTTQERRFSVLSISNAIRRYRSKSVIVAQEDALAATAAVENSRSNSLPNASLKSPSNYLEHHENCETPRTSPDYDDKETQRMPDSSKSEDEQVTPMTPRDSSKLSPPARLPPIVHHITVPAVPVAGSMASDVPPISKPAFLSKPLGAEDSSKKVEGVTKLHNPEYQTLCCHVSVFMLVYSYAYMTFSMLIAVGLLLMLMETDVEVEKLYYGLGSATLVLLCIVPWTTIKAVGETKPKLLSVQYTFVAIVSLILMTAITYECVILLTKISHVNWMPEALLIQIILLLFFNYVFRATGRCYKYLKLKRSLVDDGVLQQI